MFITFEGCESSGKSTQAAILKDYFLYTGHKVFLTKEPGGTELAEKLRNLILSAEIKDVLTEFLLFSAARRDHVLKIKLKLQEGYIVISDRFYDSSVVYQGLAKNLNPVMVAKVTDWILGEVRPNITFVLDVCLDVLQKRLNMSEKHANFYDLKDMEFHKKIKDGFLKIASAEKERLIVIDSSHDVYTVAAEIKKYIEKRLNHKDLHKDLHKN